jgi:hypothetical protein
MSPRDVEMSCGGLTMPSKQSCLQHAAELVRIAQACDDPAKKGPAYFDG